jgi:glycosyltransferase involved in cell wall biosynthesis
MACGLPVIHPDDGGAMNEMADDAGWRISAHDRYLISWGSYYVKVAPRTVAKAIRQVRKALEDKSTREDWASRLKRRAAAYQWPEVSRALLRELELALKKGRKPGWKKG